MYLKIKKVKELSMKKDKLADSQIMMMTILISIMIDFCILFFFYFVWLLSLSNSAEDSQAIISSTGYVDLTNKAHWYQQIFILDCVCLVFVIVKIIQVFRISRYVHWVMMTLEKSVAVIGALMVILVPAVLGFTFFSFIIFGPYNRDFNSFHRSVASVFFFAMGQQNTAEMVLYNEWVTLLWSELLFLFMLFIFISCFMAIFIDSFRQTV
jgi:hypothetical protein